MPDTDRVGNVQKDILKRLAVVISENQDDLEEATQNGRINAVAWLTRNLLRVVAKAAKEIGKAEAFRDVNKLLSKFAHPTAMSTLHSGSDTIDKLKQQFYGVGKRLAQESLSSIARFEKNCCVSNTK
jgi:hypothetical protein